MKKVLRFKILALLMVLAFADARAQHDPLFTQHNFNRLAFNPAYAGSREMSSLTAMYRNQWVNVPGCPRTATFTAHAPLRNNRVALGFMLMNDNHGIIDETSMWMSYAYRIPMGPGKLSMGLSSGIANYKMMLTQASSGDISDPDLVADQNLWLPNFGFGVYYYTGNWFAGASVPHLINHELNRQAVTLPNSLPARQWRHYYAMAGYVFPLTDGLKFRATTLMKAVAQAPIQFDLNGSFLIQDRLWLGMAYRTNASVDFNMVVNITQQFRFGYAYDYVIGDLGNYTAGSHEILIGFDFKFEGNQVITPRNINPRYF